MIYFWIFWSNFSLEPEPTEIWKTVNESKET